MWLEDRHDRVDHSLLRQRPSGSKPLWTLTGQPNKSTTPLVTMETMDNLNEWSNSYMANGLWTETLGAWLLVLRIKLPPPPHGLGTSCLALGPSTFPPPPPLPDATLMAGRATTHGRGHKHRHCCNSKTSCRMTRRLLCRPHPQHHHHHQTTQNNQTRKGTHRSPPRYYATTRLTWRP